MSHVMKSLKRGHLVSDGHFACGGGVFRLTRYIWISYCNQFPVQIKTVKTVGRRIIYHLVGRGQHHRVECVTWQLRGYICCCNNFCCCWDFTCYCCCCRSLCNSGCSWWGLSCCCCCDRCCIYCCSI